jgi:hypothetical protein
MEQEQKRKRKPGAGRKRNHITEQRLLIGADYVNTWDKLARRASSHRARAQARARATRPNPERDHVMADDPVAQVRARQRQAAKLYDPIEALRAFQEQLQNVDIRDRQKLAGRKKPLGEGTTPIDDLIGDARSHIDAMAGVDDKGKPLPGGGVMTDMRGGVDGKPRRLWELREKLEAKIAARWSRCLNRPVTARMVRKCAVEYRKFLRLTRPKESYFGT